MEKGLMWKINRIRNADRIKWKKDKQIKNKTRWLYWAIMKPISSYASADLSISVKMIEIEITRKL